MKLINTFTELKTVLFNTILFYLSVKFFGFEHKLWSRESASMVKLLKILPKYLTRVREINM